MRGEVRGGIRSLRGVVRGLKVRSGDGKKG